MASYIEPASITVIQWRTINMIYRNPPQHTHNAKPSYMHTATLTIVQNMLCLDFYLRSPDSKVHGANMGATWGRQDPGGPHVGHVNVAIWVTF